VRITLDPQPDRLELEDFDIWGIRMDIKIGDKETSDFYPIEVEEK
jgi:hypothetical protein